MRRLLYCLRAVGFITLLSLLLPTDAAAVSVDGKLELWFEYNGRQATFTAIPRINCLRKQDGMAVACDLYRSEDGRYWIDRLPYGNYLIDVELSEDELYRQYAFNMARETTGPLLIGLNRVIHLQQPEVHEPLSATTSVDCREYERHKVPILALFQRAELSLNWQPVNDADAYHYKVWRMRCADGMRIEPVQIGKVQSNNVDENVPPNEVGEYYSFELIARRGNQDIGQLLLRNEAGGMRNGYPFVVVDPLGDRSWYPYLVLALLSPLLLWLFWRLLLGIAALNPGRGFAWLSLVALVILAGYQLRQELFLWSEQGRGWLQQKVNSPQKWYRNETGKEAYTEGQSINDGIWSGYLVATGNSPFFGTTRRLEIRIRFQTQTAKVSLLQDGRWQRVSGEDFTLRRSGLGMTLFGHTRNAQTRELWTISIAETNTQTLRLALDRMITRLDTGKEQLVSERRQATGELRHSLQ
jgi:hypothetical protein